MKALRIYLTINVVLALIFGLALLIFPTEFTSGQGIVLTPSGLLFARTLGGIILAIAVLNWYARDLKDWKMIQGVLITNFLVHAFGVLIDGTGIAQGVVNSSGWGNVGFRSLLALGFIYFLIKKPRK